MRKEEIWNIARLLLDLVITDKKALAYESLTMSMFRNLLDDQLLCACPACK